MPSIKSLTEHQYYGHPQNRFWKILQNIYEEECSSYQDKIQLLHKHHIALWDVIAACERQGSLDSNITSEECNDITSFLKTYPTIEKIILNGKKAGALYKKTSGKMNSTPYVVLPSTSPANASFSLSELTELWRKELIVINTE